MVFSGILSATEFFLLIPLFMDQLKNLFSNSTSYERAKNIKRKKNVSLLTEKSSVNEIESEKLLSDEEEQEDSCGKNCCAILS